jgi:hypothetical protein
MFALRSFRTNLRWLTLGLVSGIAALEAALRFIYAQAARWMPSATSVTQKGTVSPQPGSIPLRSASFRSAKPSPAGFF